MSRCNPKTGHRVWHTKKEMESLTRAYVALASNAYLNENEKKTLRMFRDTWFSGDDFVYDESRFGTYKRFFSICAKFNVSMPIMRRPRVPKGEKAGSFYLSEMTVEPDLNGGCWPAYDSSESWEHRQKLKREYRILVMNRAKAELGVYEIDLGDVQAAKAEVAEVEILKEAIKPVESNVIVFKPKVQSIEFGPGEVDFFGMSPHALKEVAA